MASVGKDGKRTSRPHPHPQINDDLWHRQLTPIAIINSSEVDVIKMRLNSGCSSNSTTATEFSASERPSLSDEDPASVGNATPKLFLPILYEDEENPVVVKITCKKCLDMEVLLRNFTEMHLKAYESCKGKTEGYWDHMVNWNQKLQNSLQAVKFHLVGEFITHMDQTPLSVFKEDHDFRTQFNHYRLLFTHMKSMESRFNERREELNCPTRENFNISMSDKILRDLHMKISSSRTVLEQIEQRIRAIARSWDNAQADTNHGFRHAIFTKEDYIFNRLSNIFTCFDFLQTEQKLYQDKAKASKPTRKSFLPILQFKPRQEEDQCPKLCNVKRRTQNSVKRKLPSSIAHFYPFAKPQYMDEIHASWFRTFLRPEDMRKEIGQQRETNMRVLSDIKQLKHDIHQLEVQLKLKEFADQSVKSGREDDITFPEKVSKASTFIDFNSLF